MASALMGILAGATAAYMLDPAQGRRRRALVREKALKTYREGWEFADAASRDLRNHAKGLRKHPTAIVGMARHEFMRRNWSPAARTVSAAAGSALMLLGLARGGLSGLASFVAGAAVLARAGVNRPFAELPQSMPLKHSSSTTTEAKESA
jgi:hypothetical protein